MMHKYLSNKHQLQRYCFTYPKTTSRTNYHLSKLTTVWWKNSTFVVSKYSSRFQRCLSFYIFLYFIINQEKLNIMDPDSEIGFRTARRLLRFQRFCHSVPVWLPVLVQGHCNLDLSSLSPTMVTWHGRHLHVLKTPKCTVDTLLWIWNFGPFSSPVTTCKCRCRLWHAVNEYRYGRHGL